MKAWFFAVGGCLMACCAAGNATAAFAGESSEYYLDPVVVLGQARQPDYFDCSLRQHTEIDALPQRPGMGPGEKLQAIPSVDVLRRGPAGVQSDIQIRGASFEQTDVVLDGVRINDPQTGHFNLDLPLLTEDIERIVVVSGPSPGMYGSAGEGGAIHVFSAPPRQPGVEAGVALGSYQYQAARGAATYQAGPVLSRTSLGQASSDGFRPNTDFDQQGISHTSRVPVAGGELNCSVHALDKEFGAAGFYSEFYPNQWEHTKTILTSAAWEPDAPAPNITPRVYVRRHEDRFLLDRQNPDFFENRHTNYVSGCRLDAEIPAGDAGYHIGNDLARESIDSTNMGDHQRLRDTLYTQYRSDCRPFMYSLGAAALLTEDFSDEFAPDCRIGYWLLDTVKWRAGYSRAVRFPTYTELCYHSPANNGNPALMPERSDTYEMGVDYLLSSLSWSLTGFQREGENMIDWSRPVDGTVYQAENLSHITTQGLETMLTWRPADDQGGGIAECFAGYTFLSRNEAPTGRISKYVFDYAQHSAVLGSSLHAPGQSIVSVIMRYRQPVDRGGDCVWHSRWSRKAGRVGLFAEIENIFDQAYEEVRGIPMPGRSFYAGCSLQM